jgi:hypothetical protein
MMRSEEDWALLMQYTKGKLAEGKPYQVSTDNPETIQRYIALAESLGATVTFESSDNEQQTILLAPARTA